MPLPPEPKKLYDYLDDNPACMAAPISYTNDVRTVAQLDNFISINNAVDVDLYGQVNGETAGIKQISGAGGQQDFVLGAYLSKGGKSFICLSSTHENKDGTRSSRIRPTLQPGSVVTDTRVNTMYVVTEYGCVSQGSQCLGAGGKAHLHRPPRLPGGADPGSGEAEDLVSPQQKMNQ